MGYTSANISRAEVVEMLTSRESFTSSRDGAEVVRETIAKKFVGNNLYALERIERTDVEGHTATDYSIVVHLIRKHGHQWAWKSYTEDDGPFYYDAPVAWLDQYPLPEGASPSRIEWRTLVRKQRARRRFLADAPAGVKLPTYVGTANLIETDGTHKGGRIHARVISGESHYLGKTYAWRTDQIDWDKAKSEYGIDPS